MHKRRTFNPLTVLTVVIAAVLILRILRAVAAFLLAWCGIALVCGIIVLAITLIRKQKPSAADPTIVDVSYRPIPDTLKGGTPVQPVQKKRKFFRRPLFVFVPIFAFFNVILFIAVRARIEFSIAYLAGTDTAPKHGPVWFAYNISMLALLMVLFFFVNRRLLFPKPKRNKYAPPPPPPIPAVETLDSVAAALVHYAATHCAVFKAHIDQLADQARRFSRKKQSILDVLRAKFEETEMSHHKFTAAIDGAEDLMFRGMKSFHIRILNFDEEEYLDLWNPQRGFVPANTALNIERKKILDEQLQYANKTVEMGQQILLRLDRLALEITKLSPYELDHAEELDAVRELDALTQDTKLYR